jgi:hypothetical protein
MRLNRLRAGLKLELATIAAVILIVFFTAAITAHTDIGSEAEAFMVTWALPAVVLCVLVSDGVYSVLLVLVFVHPIWKTTAMAGNAGVRTTSVCDMKTTCYNALTGGCIAVVSSTCLYVLFFVGFGLFYTETVFVDYTVLNPLLVGINLDSMLNDLVQAA